MFTTPDEARSDLFLAGAVYVIGPLLVGTLLGFLPLGGVPGLALALALVLPLAYTVLVPYLLVRYRKERFAEYGFNGPATAVPTALLAALPIIAAPVLIGLVADGDPLALPLLVAVTGGGVGALLVRVVTVVGLTLLAIYGTVKARDGFISDPVYLGDAVQRIGRFVALVGGAATVLLLASSVLQDPSAGELLSLVLQPAAVGAAVVIAWRRARSSRLTTRPTLITPMVLFAIGSFTIFAGPSAIVFGLWRAALMAGVGLLVGLLVESERSAWPPLVLGSLLALFANVPIT